MTRFWDAFKWVRTLLILFLNYGDILIFSGERPFCCDVCHKGFITKDSLMKHSVGHTQERRYKCGECGKLFKRMGHVRTHLLHTHSSDKPYLCAVCNKGFKTKVWTWGGEGGLFKRIGNIRVGWVFCLIIFNYVIMYGYPNIVSGGFWFWIYFIQSWWWSAMTR